jgi:hypothetical protein
MNLLINDKEIVHFLISLLKYESITRSITPSEDRLSEAIGWWFEKKRRLKDQFDKHKYKLKFKNRLIKAIESDARSFTKDIKKSVNKEKKRVYESISKQLDFFIKRFGEERLLQLYKKSKKQNFVKSVGLHLCPDPVLVRRKNYQDNDDDCLIRNTVGNENLLIRKIDNNLPFWFIDSGYTNFIENNKRWHRLVRNHLHFGTYLDFPADRLQNLISFPAQWRTSGEDILVIEPGPLSAGIFHIDIDKWKIQIEEEIRRYSDKKIVFREKAPKKIRPSLYRELLDNDYYCVININSNAATEAIWAGVPVITLDKHISNPVSRSKISDINDLYRGPLGNWLCMLSYNQFTFDELINGKAVEICREYHEKI